VSTEREGMRELELRCFDVGARVVVFRSGTIGVHRSADLQVPFRCLLASPRPGRWVALLCPRRPAAAVSKAGKRGEGASDDSDGGGPNEEEEEEEQMFGGSALSFELEVRDRSAVVSALTERRLLRHAVAVAERDGDESDEAPSLRFMLGEELASGGRLDLAVGEWVRCVRHVAPDAVTQRLSGREHVGLCAAYLEACAAALDEAETPGGRPAGVLGRYRRLIREYRKKNTPPPRCR